MRWERGRLSEEHSQIYVHSVRWPKRYLCRKQLDWLGFDTNVVISTHIMRSAHKPVPVLRQRCEDACRAEKIWEAGIFDPNSNQDSVETQSTQIASFLQSLTLSINKTDSLFLLQVRFHVWGLGKSIIHIFFQYFDRSFSRHYDARVLIDFLGSRISLRAQGKRREILGRRHREFGCCCSRLKVFTIIGSSTISLSSIIVTFDL